MKKLIWPLISVLVFGTSIYTVTNHNKNKPKALYQIIKEKETPTRSIPDVDKVAALNFKLKDLNGKDVSLSDFKGKKILLNFWASWCGPCISEMPDIEKLYNETKGSDLVILTVNLGEDKSTVKSFTDINKYSFTVLLDLDEIVGRQYSIANIPTTFFIDKEGNVVSFVKGSITLEKMKTYISKL